MHIKFIATIMLVAFLSILQSEEIQKENLDYLISPYDLLSIDVFQEPDLNKQIRVEATGFIVLPLIGKVKVVGLTVEKAQKLLEDLYEKDYLVDAHINIFVSERKINTVRIFGQVGRQGDVEIKPDRPLTILDAIAAVGGGSRLADLRKVVLTRQNPKNRDNPEIINVEVLIEGDDSSKSDYILEVGDTVFVPERFF